MKTRKLLLIPVLLILIGGFIVIQQRSSGQPLPQEATAVPGEMVSQYINVGDLTRSYLIYLPSGYTADASLPLVIALHSSGGNGATIAHLTDFSTLADSENFIVLYPDGTLGDWDFGYGVKSANGQRNAVDDVGFLRALIDMAVTSYGADPARVYVTGFADGASMSYRAACELADKVTAFAAVAASISLGQAQHCTDTIPVSAMMIHGTRDPVLPFGELQDQQGNTVALSEAGNLAFWSQRNNCQTGPESIKEGEGDLPLVTGGDDTTQIQLLKYEDCDGGTSAELYAVINGGHAWPGHALDVPFDIGHISMDFDATAVIWDFFKSQVKQAAE